MKIQKQEIPLFHNPSNLDFSVAEKAMRCCYQSQGKSDGTMEGARKFVKIIAGKKHKSSLRFVPFYFMVDPFSVNITHELNSVMFSEFSTRDYVIINGEARLKVYTNVCTVHDKYPRMYNDIINGELIQDEYGIELFEPVLNDPLKYVAFSFIASRAICDEIRTYSDLFTHAMLSTRYVSFESLLIVDNDDYDMETVRYYEGVEYEYRRLIGLGRKDSARKVLPLATRTEMYSIAPNNKWKHFVEQRTATGAHYDIRELANTVKYFV